MNFPEFFDAAPRIRLRDPLSELLGAAVGGILEYCYADAVRFAGHSCPTVAGAYALTRRALQALYGVTLPERGGLRVEFSASSSIGVTGVVAGVVTLITGASGEGGFKGLAGRHVRRGLLAFAADVPMEIRYSRLDGGGAVDTVANLAAVPGDPRMGRLLQSCLDGTATADAYRELGELWQDRVRRILLDHGDDPDVFTVQTVQTPGRR